MTVRIPASDFWHLDAAPQLLRDAARGWRTFSEDACDLTTTFEGTSDALYRADADSGPWEGRSAEFYRTRWPSLGDCITSSASSAVTIAVALVEAARALADTQACLDECHRRLVDLLGPIDPAGVELGPGDDRAAPAQEIVDEAEAQYGSLARFLTFQAREMGSAGGEFIRAQYTPPALEPALPAGSEEVIPGTRFNDTIRVTFDRETQTQWVQVNKRDPVPYDGNVHLTIRGRTGHDRVIVDPDAPGVTVFGGWGDDVVRGGGGVDHLYGEEGNDYLEGGGDDDVMDGGGDHDVLYGLGGSDRIAGGDGRDYIDGGRGDDYLDGGRGKDMLAGGHGDDVISGGEHDDVISTGAGADTVDGGSGQDTVYPQPEDTVAGVEERTETTWRVPGAVEIDDETTRIGEFVFIKGSAQFRERVVSDYESWWPPVQDMYHALSAATIPGPDGVPPGHTLTIHEREGPGAFTHSDTKDAGDGRQVRIEYNPGYILPIGDVGRPPLLALFHETGHGYTFFSNTHHDDMAGDADDTDPDRFAPSVELQVAGIEIAPEVIPENLTEAALATTLGLPRPGVYKSGATGDAEPELDDR